MHAPCPADELVDFAHHDPALNAGALQSYAGGLAASASAPTPQQALMTLTTRGAPILRVRPWPAWGAAGSTRPPPLALATAHLPLAPTPTPTHPQHVFAAHALYTCKQCAALAEAALLLDRRAHLPQAFADSCRGVLKELPEIAALLRRTADWGTLKEGFCFLSEPACTSWRAAAPAVAAGACTACELGCPPAALLAARVLPCMSASGAWCCAPCPATREPPTADAPSAPPPPPNSPPAPPAAVSNEAFISNSVSKLTHALAPVISAFNSTAAVVGLEVGPEAPGAVQAQATDLLRGQERTHRDQAAMQRQLAALQRQVEAKDAQLAALRADVIGRLDQLAAGQQQLAAYQQTANTQAAALLAQGQLLAQQQGCSMAVHAATLVLAGNPALAQAANQNLSANRARLTR